MEDLSSEQLNVSWNVLKAWLCNHTIIHTDKLNVTCETLNRGNNSYYINGTEDISPEILKVAIMAGIIFLIGIIFNIGLLITSSNNKRFRKPSWKYITNLAVADILCMITMAGFVLYILATPVTWSNGLHDYLFPSLDIFLSSASMLSVAAIALDRVYTIRFLEKQVSSPVILKPTLVIASIWGYSIIIFSLALCRIIVKRNRAFNKIVFWVATSIAFFGAVMVTIICYVIIIFYYIKYTFSSSNQILNSSVPQLLREDETDGINMVREHKIKQKRITKAFLTAMTPLPFIMGWSFFLGTQTYEIVTKKFITDIHYNIAMIIVPWLVSALNPVVYMLLTASIRKQVKTTLRRLFRFSTGKPSHYDESIHLTEI